MTDDKLRECYRKHLEVLYNRGPSSDFNEGYRVGISESNEELKALKEENYQLRTTGSCARLEEEIRDLRDKLRYYESAGTELPRDEYCLRCKDFKLCHRSDPYERSSCPKYGNSKTTYAGEGGLFGHFYYQENKDYKPIKFRGATGGYINPYIVERGHNYLYQDISKQLIEFLHYFYNSESCISIKARVENNKTSVTEQDFIIAGDKYDYKKRGFGIIDPNSAAVKSFKNLVEYEKRGKQFKHDKETKVHMEPWYATEGLGAQDVRNKCLEKAVQAKETSEDK